MAALTLYLPVVIGFGVMLGNIAKGRADLCRWSVIWWRRAPYGVLLAVAFNTGVRAETPAGETPTEADVAYATANVLSRAQLSHRPLDDLLSSQFFAGYLDTLDDSHLVFLQSDTDEFGWFRPRMAQMAVSEGDTWPAHLIYARFLERLAQQVDFETNVLQTAKFDFTRREYWQPYRHDLKRPRDLDAAHGLWREKVRSDYLQEKLAGSSPAKIAAQLRQRYERRLQIMSQFDSNEVLEIYLDALARAFDPHSDYFGHEAAQEFNTEMNLSLVGIGGSLESKGGDWIVGDLIPGGPAARSGLLHPGDQIIGVAQDDGETEDVTAVPWWHVVNLLRGPEGSKVRLTIIPAGQGTTARKTVSLVREVLRLADEYAQAAIIDLPRTNGDAIRVGIINLPIFYESSGPNGAGASADTARLLDKLKQEGIAGLILDLRRNRGGLLPEAIGLTGLFIPRGPVLQTRDSTGLVEVERSPGTNAMYSGPLVVLTSRVSASSSEIVAGALQDYGRALIVGDSSTFGKGTVQNLVPLRKILQVSGFGAVKVTVAKFYRPSGASTQLKGVVPDIVLPSETDLPSIAEARLPNALPWDIVPPANYTNFDWVRPVLLELREKSRARVAADPGFRLVRAELATAAKEESQPLSLNEPARWRESAKANELQAERHNIQLADSARRPGIYNLTLANVETEELPPPRQLAPPIEAAAQLKDKSPDDDIELREAENILADYIQSLRVTPRKGIVAPAQPK